MMVSDSFGCAACFGEDAEALWQARPWQHVESLVEESHSGVSLLSCAACGQRFVKIFTEFVDWSGGDDAQHWDVVPISADEARDLSAQGEEVSPQQLGQLGAGRRRLQVDFPTGGARSVRFATGAFWVTQGH